jgi:hypothetical protein
MTEEFDLRWPMNPPSDPRPLVTAKTTAERQRLLRERRLALGQTRLEVYAHPEDHEPIKTLAAKLQRKRNRKEPK